MLRITRPPGYEKNPTGWLLPLGSKGLMEMTSNAGRAAAAGAEACGAGCCADATGRVTAIAPSRKIESCDLRFMSVLLLAVLVRVVHLKCRNNRGTEWRRSRADNPLIAMR